MSEKIRVAYIGDSPFIFSGFGVVAKAIMSRLDPEIFELYMLGTMFQGYPSKKELATIPALEQYNATCIHDMMGFKNAIDFIQYANPDVLFLIGDPGTLRSRFNVMMLTGATSAIPAVTYFPLEGAPFSPHIVEQARMVHGPVTYTQWGMDLMKDYGVEVDWVWHGCFSADTHVLLPDGSSCRIDDAVRNKIKSVVGLVDGKLGTVCVDDWFTIPAMEKALKITLDNGTVLNVTKDNKVLTDCGWVCAGDLTIGSKCGILNVDIPYWLFGTSIRDLRENESAEWKEGETWWSKVVQIEEVDIGIVYDLKTSSHNFIANNVIVHNCDHAPFERYDDSIRKRLKELVGWQDRFVVGMVGVNKRVNRQPSMIETARILKDSGMGDDVVMYMHCQVVGDQSMGGWDLSWMVEAFDVENIVQFKPNQVEHRYIGRPRTGTLEGVLDRPLPKNETEAAENLAMLDFISLLNTFDLGFDPASAHGFNLPAAEISRCGIPIATVDDKFARSEIFGDCAYMMKPTASDFWHTGAALPLVSPKRMAETIIEFMDDEKMVAVVGNKCKAKFDALSWEPVANLFSSKLIDAHEWGKREIRRA